LGDLVGLQIGNLLIFEEDLSFVGFIEAAYTIENGGLPCSVGPDDRVNFAFFHGKTNFA